jgi:putative PIN family toxin of toxin-antitoxin system
MSVEKNKIILDTNTLINGFVGDFSYSSRIIEECLQGKLRAYLSPSIQRENNLILKRLISDQTYQDYIQNFLKTSTLVYPTQKITNYLEDPEDEKFLECAQEIEADYIITEDHHLLDLGKFQNTRILTPQEFWNIYSANSDSAWSDWAKQIGIR